MDEKIVKKLEALYAKLPAIDCKRMCHKSCGPIDMSQAEKNIIINRLGYDPFLMHYQLMELKNCTYDSLQCPLLDGKTKLCTIYDVRPLICRLYGLVKRMQCPFGCKPARWVKDKEAFKIFREANDLLKKFHGGIVGTGY